MILYIIKRKGLNKKKVYEYYTMAARELMKTVSCKILHGFGFGLGMGSALQLANIIGPNKSYKDNPGQSHNHPNYRCQHESSPPLYEKKMENQENETFKESETFT